MSSSDDFVIIKDITPESENIFHWLIRDQSQESLQTLNMLINNDNSHLIQKYDFRGLQCIHLAAMRDSYVSQQKFELLLRWGADINSQDKIHGNTPLHYAVLTNNYGLASWICEQFDVVIDVYNSKKKTPWQIAHERQEVIMMELLKSYGAQCTVSDLENQE